MTVPGTAATATAHEEKPATPLGEKQPTSPAGPAKDVPSSIAMRDDSTKAQNDTRPPPPSSDSTSHADTTTTTGASSSSLPSANDDKKATGTTGTTGRSDEAQAQAETSSNNKTDEKSTEKSDTDNPDVKIDGPGPRPLEEIAREHGGDAGNAKADSIKSGEQQQQPGEPGALGGAEHRRRDSGKGLGEEEQQREGEGEGKSEDQGTGEEYVQSSGLAADGGDFDASRPGAGREADREFSFFFFSLFSLSLDHSLFMP